MKIDRLITRRDSKREQGKVVGRLQGYHGKYKIRVMTNIEKPWYGRQPLTPSIGMRD